MDDEIAESPTREDLTERAHEAVQALVTDTYGPMVVRKWMCYAETVDDEDDQPMIFVVNSRMMPPWDLYSLAHFGYHLVQDITEI